MKIFKSNALLEVYYVLLKRIPYIVCKLDMSPEFTPMSISDGAMESAIESGEVIRICLNPPQEVIEAAERLHVREVLNV